ncbi:MAG: type IV secretion system protein VirB10 [Pseudomonadota bacterium]
MMRSSDRDPRQEAPDATMEALTAAAMPKVARDGGDAMGMIGGLAALAMLGVFVFTQMSDGRRQASVDDAIRDTRLELEQARSDVAAARTEAARARSEAESARRRMAAAARTPSTARAAPAAAQDLPPKANLRSPALVVDNSRPRPPEADAADGAAGPGAGADNGLTASDLFANRVSGGGLEPVRATMIEDPSRVAPQGTIIAGVLETAINSDLPGYARAVVSEDVRSLDSRRILIPRGSRLIGQYRSGLAIGESRAFVIWTRLLRPDGVSVELASPATDTLGRAGLPGDVDRHFFQRFGSAILLSVVGAGANAAVQSGDSAIIIGSTSQAEAVAAEALSQQINIPPTITVDQGAEIRIFLARDLYFPEMTR